MNIHNIDLEKIHLEEIQNVLNENSKNLEKNSDSILVLEDETKVLCILRNGLYIVQYLDRLI